ncbi:MAG: hypothetical protein ACJ701_08520 [Nitrososphaera sp.]
MEDEVFCAELFRRKIKKISWVQVKWSSGCYLLPPTTTTKKKVIANKEQLTLYSFNRMKINAINKIDFLLFSSYPVNVTW